MIENGCHRVWNTLQCCGADYSRCEYLNFHVKGFEKVNLVFPFDAHPYFGYFLKKEEFFHYPFTVNSYVVLLSILFTSLQVNGNIVGFFIEVVKVPRLNALGPPTRTSSSDTKWWSYIRFADSRWLDSAASAFLVRCLLNFLGHLVSSEGIWEEVIHAFPQLTSQCQLREFIGLVNFYWCFLPSCAAIMHASSYW